ncbi:hypothetical protein DL93DRAFT_2201702, partial [Clavulina sp. PMI_390]
FKLPTYFTSFDELADALIESFNSLGSDLSNATVASIWVDLQSTKIGVEHIKIGVNYLVKENQLHVLPYASNADGALHDGNKSGCFPGTRIAILEALQTWAMGDKVLVTLNPLPHPLTPNVLDLSQANVLWLQGMAGSGKSSIAISLAKYLRSASVCTAFYRFETAKKESLNPSNLITTITLQLAKQNHALEDYLVELVTSSATECGSQDPEDQLKWFLLPLLRKNSESLNQVVIIIDALDESGVVSVRKKLRIPLAQLAKELPPAAHILITTRPESDIQKMVDASQSARLSELFMDNLPNQSTRDDIHQYTSQMLKELTPKPTAEQLKQLSGKAELSFQWASTACRYIMDEDDKNKGVGPTTRLRRTLESSGSTLDSLYTMVLNAQFSDSESPDLRLLRLLLGILVVAKEPLSLHAISQLVNVHHSDFNEIEDIKQEAERLLGKLSSLIAGAKSSAPNGPPLLPLHASFYDFLQNADSNHKYCVDAAQTHKSLTESCFAVMESGEKRLMFNICQLPTSFIPNYSIPDLGALIQDKIGETLSYACHFWGSHLALATDLSPSTVGSITALLSTVQLLYWIEVMSLTGASPSAVLSLKLMLSYVQPASDITAFAKEALLFATYYAIPISLSTPHIYLSAVPFIPTMSPL